MPRQILGAGNRRPTLFLCGERPGYDEYRAGQGFVGVSGQELWDRLYRTTGLKRSACWVTNLVKSFSTAPPSPKEIARDAPILRSELRDIRPTLIITVGAHAARWFCPQLRERTQDYFHGLPFASPRVPAVVFPIVHPAAALRQPDLYQEQFTNDLRALDLLLRRGDRREPHRPDRPLVHEVGLAGMYGVSVGLDTEGFRGAGECATVSAHGLDAALVDFAHHTTGALATTLATAPTIAIHHAKHDWQILAERDLHLDARKVRDTMIEAYLLNEPQALKVLSYRLLGWVLSEYDDLVRPLDDAAVRSYLEAAHGTLKEKLTLSGVLGDPGGNRRSRKRHPHAQAAARGADVPQSPQGHAREGAAREGQGTEAAHGQGQPARRGAAEVQCTEGSRRGGSHRGARTQGAEAQEGAGQAAPLPPKRILTSLRKILDTDTEESRRHRWLASKFSPLLPPLPPAPTWRDVPAVTRIPSALTDAVAHRAVHETFLPRLRAARLSRVYRIDRGILPFLVRNEQVGVAVDTRELGRLERRFDREYATTLAEIHRLAGREVNPLASADISDTIFDDWGVTPTRLTRTGFHTTQDKYLKARKGEHDGIPLILEARQINKMQGTYTRRLPKLLRDGRYHPNWKYTRTASGRAAEEIILLIPKHSARGKAIRNCFVAADGHVLVSCDLSQIEMRTMAHESRDPIFLRNYARGIDMHADTAHQLLGAPKAKADQDESLHRLPAKTLNFGVLMGMTEYGLVDQLHEQGQAQWVVDLEEAAIAKARGERYSGTPDEREGAYLRACQAFERELRAQGFKSTREFRTEWFRLYKGVARWVEEKKREAMATGYVRDLWGRRIAVSGIWSTDRRIAAEFARKAHAIPIQSGAIGIAKRWGARIYDQVIAPRIREGRRYCEPWVWVHDDFTVEADARIRRTVAREMLALVPQDLCVPVTADAKSGVKWGDLH